MQNNENAKKAGIKQAAKELFFRFGFSKTSMDDIARQSSLAKPSLYYYFPNKEAIFDEVVIDEAEQFIIQAEKKLTPGMPADEKVAAFIRNIYFELKEYAVEISKLPEALSEQYPHGRPIIEKINAIIRKRLRPWLAEGNEQGIFALEDENATVQALAFLTCFLNLDWMQRVPEETRDQVVETVIQIVLYGIKRRK